MRTRVVAIAIIVSVIATIAVFLLRGSDTSEAPILPQARFMASYRIVYEIEEFDAQPRTEERIVRRPYFSKIVSQREGTLLAGSITNEQGRWLLLPDGQGWQLRARGRQRPIDDPQPIDALEAAAEDGRAEKRGTDVVLGRTCSVVRTGGPLGEALRKPTAEEYVDLCVDRTGAVLRERWVLKGVQARLTVATVFEPDAALGTDDLVPTPTAPPLPDGVTGIANARALSEGESAPIPVRGVAGYRADGPAVAVERDLAGRGLEITFRQSFVKGARLVVVEQGVRAGGPDPKGRPVDLGSRRTGYLDLGFTASILTLVTDGTGYVRVVGADVDALEVFGRDIAGRLD